MPDTLSPRMAARATGVKTYLSDDPCKACQARKRYTINGACIVCQRQSRMDAIENEDKRDHARAMANARQARRRARLKGHGSPVVDPAAPTVLESVFNQLFVE